MNISSQCARALSYQRNNRCGCACVFITYLTQDGDKQLSCCVLMFKGEVRVHNKLGSNERIYNAYLAYKVSCLHIKYNPRNKATNLLKFACRAAAIIYIEAKPRSCSGFTL